MPEALLTKLFFTAALLWLLSGFIIKAIDFDSLQDWASWTLISIWCLCGFYVVAFCFYSIWR